MGGGGGGRGGGEGGRGMATYQLAAGRGRRLRQTWPRGVVGVG